MRRGNGSGKLKDEHRAFLVGRLAVYDTPKQASDALKAEYGVDITPQGAEAYDPAKRAGSRLSERWRKLFDSTRFRFLENIEDIPAANKAVRVRKLARAADAFEQRGNYIAMARMLEQIAKETGGSFDNLRKIEHTGRDGGPIQKEDITAMTQEQLKAEIFQLLGVELPISDEPETAKKH